MLCRRWGSLGCGMVWERREQCEEDVYAHGDILRRGVAVRSINGGVDRWIERRVRLGRVYASGLERHPLVPSFIPRKERLLCDVRC